jgi:hypothetical protein
MKCMKPLGTSAEDTAYATGLFLREAQVLFRHESPGNRAPLRRGDAHGRILRDAVRRSRARRGTFAGAGHRRACGRGATVHARRAAPALRGSPGGAGFHPRCGRRPSRSQAAEHHARRHAGPHLSHQGARLRRGALRRARHEILERATRTHARCSRTCRARSREGPLPPPPCPRRSGRRCPTRLLRRTTGPIPTARPRRARGRIRARSGPRRTRSLRYRYHSSYCLHKVPSCRG